MIITKMKKSDYYQLKDKPSTAATVIDGTWLHKVKNFVQPCKKDVTIAPSGASPIKNDATIFVPQIHKKLLPKLQLTIVSGVEKGRIIEIEPGKNTFGRDAKNSIRFNDSTISSSHGVIEYSKEGSITVYDTASRNGISIHGKVAPVLTVKFGDIVQVGSLYIQVGQKQLSKKWMQMFRKMPLWTRYMIVIAGLTGLSLGVAFVTRYIVQKPQSTKIENKKQSVGSSKVKPSSTSARRVHSRSIGSQQKEMPRRDPRKEIIPSKLAVAEEAMQKGDYESSFGLYHQVLQIDPRNAMAHEGLENLQQLAAKLIEDAMMLSSSDARSASQKLGTVMRITEPQSEYYERAQELLTKWRKA